MSDIVEKPIVKSFNCPNCGSTLEIKALGTTLSVVCHSCKSIIDANDPNYKILAQAKSKISIRPHIPIGTRGTFSGKVYEVIGFMQRRDGTFYWREYLLFNPYLGFRWLTEIDGHWSYVKKIHKIDGDESGWNKNERYRNKSFRLFNRGSATVDYVVGEFYWRVKVGDRVQMYDFISPPYMISKEESKDEVNWSQSIYLERDRVASIFNIDEKDLPYQNGVAANQPSQLKKNLKVVFKYALSALIACFIIQSLFFFVRDNKTVYAHKHFIKPISDYRSGKFKEIKSSEFEIKGDNKNLSFYTSSNVSNSWVYLGAALINKTTQEVIQIPMEVSYYFGSDWSEGSRNRTIYRFNIPAGVYYLYMEPQAGGRQIPNQYVNIRIQSDVIIGSNFYWALFICLLPLFFAGLRSRSFEVRRWSNSSENPYEVEE